MNAEDRSLQFRGHFSPGAEQSREAQRSVKRSPRCVGFQYSFVFISFASADVKRLRRRLLEACTDAEADKGELARCTSFGSDDGSRPSRWHHHGRCCISPFPHRCLPRRTAARRGGCRRTLQEEERAPVAAATALESSTTAVERQYHDGTAARGRVIWTPLQTSAHGPCAVIELSDERLSAAKNEATGRCG
ncbi:hypothetical protein HPB50_026286 [Hyalomma asiaticum]|uniref:Uncharacterized protein n=1 Tax=Hyalomma asiaticum TaxID=266040 RepID=A0ACB7SRI4_HYAAI|nr:hypothetical protein HPB50_026286 [Hyalomma asiaticum]